MEEHEQFAKVSYEIVEQLLEVESLEDALAGSLEIIVKYLKCEAAAIWILDQRHKRLYPMFHKGPSDISGVSIEYGTGIESMVVENGKSVIIENVHDVPGFIGTVFDGGGFVTRSMLCVPLKDRTNTFGCVQIINRPDGSHYTQEELLLCERAAALAAMTITEKGLVVAEPEDKEVLVSLRNVTKEFQAPGGVSRVLKGINLDVYKGELLVVLGESGCGKSTMMNIIGGMDSLTDGELIIEGKDYSHPSEVELTKYRRQDIGFIFQSYNLMPNLSALENVRFIAEICDNSIAPEEALRQTGLEDYSNSYPGQLSGGQQQRIAIARALVKNPKLILADEPTAALDHATSIEVLTAIENIVRNNNTTAILVTHNPEIGKMADRVVKIRGGKVFSIKKNAQPLKAAELEW